MAEDSWPSPAHSAGAVASGEFEWWASPGHVSGLVGAPTDLPLVYADNTGRSVKLRAGRYARVRGRTWYSGTGDVTKTIAANASGQNRIDLIVLRLNRTTFGVTAEVLQGTPATSPAAPATTNNTASATSGVWELPVARVSVANGVGTLSSGTVTPAGWYLADDGSVLCTSTTRPPISLVSAGTRITETDTGRTYTAVGSSFVLVSSDTGWVSLTPAAGWGANVNGFRYRLKNGVVYLELMADRTGSSLPAATSNDSTITTMPVGARPSVQIRLTGYINGAFLALATVNPNGTVVLGEYYQHGVPNGETVNFGCVAYPVD